MANLFKKYKEIIVYVIFGVMATAVSWGTYYIFVRKLNMSVTWGNVLSWVCAFLFAFITNKLWVFESKSWELKLVVKEWLNFLAARVATGILQWFVVPFLNYKTGFDELCLNIVEKIGLKFDFLFTEGIYSKILIEVVVVILNYVFSKFIVFKDKNKNS